MNNEFNATRSDFPQSDEWFTPGYILDKIEDIVPIGLDPFGSPDSFVGALKTNVYDGTPATDGFLLDWWNGRDDCTFLNPPFSQKRKFAEVWIQQCSQLKENDSTRTLFSILPSKTESKFFHNMMSVRGSYLILYKGRVSYWKKTEEGLLVEGTSPSFGSASFVYGPAAEQIASNFTDIATVISLG